jgi:hypothetical protein
MNRILLRRLILGKHAQLSACMQANGMAVQELRVEDASGNWID